MIRGISTQIYEPAEPPRLHFEPVFICDSRLLCTMMLRAWNPEADREMRRGVYRDTYRTEPVTVTTTSDAVELRAG